MDRKTPIRELLREAYTVIGVTALFAVLYYVSDWVRRDLGAPSGVFEIVGSFLTTVVGVTGVALVLIYVVARGVALGMEEAE